MEADSLKKAKKRSWDCPCGFKGYSRNIKEHRFNCEAWKEHVQRSLSHTEDANTASLSTNESTRTEFE